MSLKGGHFSSSPVASMVLSSALRRPRKVQAVQIGDDKLSCGEILEETRTLD